tara:strand:- start:2131 stop:2565 length:435 start_codon:yes stop_codon:yes gene_type:complete
MKKIVNKKPFFPRVKNIGKRNWGKEKLLVLIPKVLTLKELIIKKGNKGGLQFHRKKNECGYLISGRLLIRFDKGDGTLTKKILKKGSVFHFPPGTIHQEEALTDCKIIEASSPHFNDRVRVENLYGLKSAKGLKSTKKNQIILR